MPDRFINWPPPKEAIMELVEALARDMAREDIAKAMEAGRLQRAENPFAEQTAKTTYPG